jgi:hypothetical protein
MARLSWEQICESLPAEDEGVKPLRCYFETKSYSLRPAFDIRLKSPNNAA